MYMYARMYKYVFVCVCVCLCVYMYATMRVCRCVCMYVRMYVCIRMYVCMYVCMNTYVCMYVCMYVCVVCVRVCVCVCVFICLWVFPSSQLYDPPHMAHSSSTSKSTTWAMTSRGFPSHAPVSHSRPTAIIPPSTVFDHILLKPLDQDLQGNPPLMLITCSCLP